ACSPPNSACQPSATGPSGPMTTAPTSGLGWTRPQPRRASAVAWCSAAASNELPMVTRSVREAYLARSATYLADHPGLDSRCLNPAAHRLDPVRGQHQGHPHAEVEHLAHLIAGDVAAAGDGAEEGGPLPTGGIDHDLNILGQNPHQIPGD